MMNVFSFATPLRVAVLVGGDSAEREVSLRSGSAVVAVLESAGHRVSSIDPARHALADVDWTEFDACFIAMHGGAGEDGQVQRQLGRLGVPYTGSGPRACQLAMCKSASKERFVEWCVPTPPFVLINAHDTSVDPRTRVAPLGYPMIVKPDSQGSSLGVTVVDLPEDLASSIAAAGRYDAMVLAESLVRGREFTIAVLGDRALPMIEIVSPERVFSYEAKYQSSLTEYRFDFELPTRQRAELLHAAVAGTQALGTRGLVRVDLMVGHDGRVWVLEVNTIPGMTVRSLAPQAAERVGLGMAALCDLMVRECLSPVGVS